MTLAAVVFLALTWWGTAALLFFGGYALQFIGHAIEGNDPGEVVLVKRMLGLPYTAIAPNRTVGEDCSPAQGNFYRP